MCLSVSYWLLGYSLLGYWLLGYVLLLCLVSEAALEEYESLKGQYELEAACRNKAESFASKVNKRLSPLLLHGKNVHSWCDGSSDRSFMVDQLRYFSFQPVLHDWCNKGCGMCYPVCGMCYTVCGIMHIKESLLLTMWQQQVSSLTI